MDNEFEENEAFLLEGIVSQVRFGLSDPETIIVSVCEQVEDEGWESDFSEDWVQHQVSKLYAERQAESRLWRQPADTERLLLAFEQMRREKIVALHAAGYTQSDSLADVAELYARLREQGKAPSGHCFYHEQDMGRVIGDAGGDLLLGFYSSDPANQEHAIQIARNIISILTTHGFDTIWEADLAQRISIRNFRWQKVYTDEKELERWDHTNVLEMP